VVRGRKSTGGGTQLSDNVKQKNEGLSNYSVEKMIIGAPGGYWKKKKGERNFKVSQGKFDV